MSDFIYSKNKIEQSKLTKEIRAIYHQDSPPVEEFHGEWGSLAVSHNLYNGFQPYETDDHICVVIGGPILCFQENYFLNKQLGNEGTQAIYTRWIEGTIQWDEDLSGPFVILIINKKTSDAFSVTDIMSFIPVYKHQTATNLMLSTHVDMLAYASDTQNEIDVVSEVDFILNGVVTYPYTTYSSIRQIQPATEHVMSKASFVLQSKRYWVPEEKYNYKTINEASNALRISLQNYVNSITKHADNVAQFISGGEDSRVLSALLAKENMQEAFVFLDKMNREGKVAKKTADVYGAKFNMLIRNKLHYLNILPPCTDLIGSGSEYKHAHTFGFHKECKLDQYSAVFGGLFSDALLKGARIKKTRGSTRFSFLPQIKRRDYSAASPLRNNVFTSKVLLELTIRRKSHLNYVQSFRNESAEEWFELWPSSMNMNIPNLHANRRLFRSYEPFMSKDVVKISACVPQKWKLNRKLFHKTAKPLLKPTKWLPHSDGRLPYFSWYTNSFIQLGIKFYRKIGVKTGLTKGNQGPWGEWNNVISSPDWKLSISNYSEGIRKFEEALLIYDPKTLMEELNKNQRINLMQILYKSKKQLDREKDKIR